MISLSNSTLSLFLECPKCFWLHIVKKITRPRGIFPSLPGGMDLVIKEYFNRYRAKGILPPLLNGLVKGKLAKIALNLSYSVSEAGFKITGKLDDCLVDNELYMPLDHKTRGTLPPDEGYSRNYYQSQMDTYTLLLRESGLKTKNEAYIVYYAPGKGELHKGVPFKIVVHKLKTDPDGVHAQFLKAKKCIDSSIPEPGTNCKYCAWVKRIVSDSN